MCKTFKFCGITGNSIDNWKIKLHLVNIILLIIQLLFEDTNIKIYGCVKGDIGHCILEMPPKLRVNTHEIFETMAQPIP